MAKHPVNELQESWEDVQVAIHKLLEAGKRFQQAAQGVEGGAETASRFNQHIHRPVEQFANAEGVRVSEQSICLEIEALVAAALNR